MGCPKRVAAALLAAVVLADARIGLAQTVEARRDGDWPTFNRDLGGTRFSPLTQINTSNVATLEKAWVLRLRPEGDQTPVVGVAGYSEATPIVVNGTMYLPAGNRVLALEPETGKEIWRREIMGLSKRGVSYWPGDDALPPRLFATAGSKLIALDARTGQLVVTFGQGGSVDMIVPYNSAPTIYRNLVLVGANVQEQPAKGPPGNTRAYDARSGAKMWEFRSVPRPGELGHESWSGDDWVNRSGANNWGFFMTVDTARGIVYTTFGSPSSDFYGGDRKGANLFGNSLVAVDAETGTYKWHFQAVHHDVWDFDLPAAPGLLDVTVNGRRTPLLALIGKTGMMYLLDRTSGTPVFGVEERPVPKSDVPGEETWPTQPFPVKPPPLARNSFSMAELVTAADTTPEHAEACRALAEKSGTLYNAGPFTPFVYREPGARTRTTLVFPGAIGGTNWGGTASDPNLGYVFVNTSDYGSLGWVEERPEGSPVLYDSASVLGRPVASKFWDRKVNEKGQLLGESSWPCQRPPWGRLTAVNASTGEIAWQVTVGVTDELPEGKRNTGRINIGGPMVTAGGLVFLGATNDRRFRAFDSRTGKELWETRLDYTATAVPMTYLGRDGRQYVAIVAAGKPTISDPNPANTESLTVFALPQ